MIVGLWQLIGISVSAYVLYDSIKKKQLVRGLIFAPLIYFMPAIGLFYFSFSKKNAPHPKETKKTISAFCSKCGYDGFSDNHQCPKCNNKLHV
jgi:hypothetical protein